MHQWNVLKNGPVVWQYAFHSNELVAIAAAAAAAAAVVVDFFVMFWVVLVLNINEVVFPKLLKQVLNYQTGKYMFLKYILENKRNSVCVKEGSKHILHNVKKIDTCLGFGFRIRKENVTMNNENKIEGVEEF